MHWVTWLRRAACLPKRRLQSDLEQPKRQACVSSSSLLNWTMRTFESAIGMYGLRALHACQNVGRYVPKQAGLDRDKRQQPSQSRMESHTSTRCARASPGHSNRHCAWQNQRSACLRHSYLRWWPSLALRFYWHGSKGPFKTPFLPRRNAQGATS